MTGKAAETSGDQRRGSNGLTNHGPRPGVRRAVYRNGAQPARRSCELVSDGGTHIEVYRSRLSFLVCARRREGRRLGGVVTGPVACRKPRLAGLAGGSGACSVANRYSVSPQRFPGRVRRARRARIMLAGLGGRGRQPSVLLRKPGGPAARTQNCEQLRKVWPARGVAVRAMRLTKIHEECRSSSAGKPRRSLVPLSIPS